MYFRTFPVVSFVLFGPLVFQALAAPMHNAEAGPSTAAGDPSGSTAPSHPGGSEPPANQPETVEYGKVYGVAVKNHRSGPPLHEPLVPETIAGNSKARKTHRNAINLPHPFIPTHKEGEYHVGFAVTHNPPNLPGSHTPEPHVRASTYGKFDDAIRKIDGKTVTLQSQLLTTPRHVAPADIHKRPKGTPESLDEGKFEELKKDFCKRGTGGCSRQSKKGATRKSSAASKVKAYSKSTKTYGRASQKRKDFKGFSGKSKPVMKVKGPAGGRGTL